LNVASDVSVGRSAAPAAPTERIVAIDVVRGFALLGVLLMNNQYQFRGPGELYELSPHPMRGFFDVQADWILGTFFEAKSVTLFSFLFGMGLAIQLERAEARGAHFGTYAVRRLLALIGFGAVHLLLIWWGDILHVYAILGFVLLFFLRRRPTTILWTGMVLILVPPLLAFLVSAPSGPPMPSLTPAFVDEAIRTYRSGSWFEIAAFRLRHLEHHTTLRMATIFYPYAFGLFLLGLWTWRKGIVRSPEAHRTFLRRFLAIALPAGLILTVAPLAWRNYGHGPRWITIVLRAASFTVATPLLAFAYGSGILLLTLREGARRWLAPLAPVGRMALTNYLTQSVVMTLIMNSYGLALYGRVGPALGALICLGLFAAQIVFSRWWLSRYRFGPAEWLWRTLTYGRLQPLRLA